MKIKIDTKNGAVISGKFYDNKESKSGVILIPGFSAHKIALYELAKILSKDFKVWVFDLNSQGESTGEWNTFQMAESFKLISNLIKSKYKLKKIGVFGLSTGAHVSLMIESEKSFFDAICLASAPNYLGRNKHHFKSLRFIPYKIIRFSMILGDLLFTIINKNYRERTHPMFKTKKGYSEYAFIGATKTKDYKKLIEVLEDTPTIESMSSKIFKPILFIYGDNDKLSGFSKNSVPEDLKSMYKKIKSSDKRMVVIRGANHSLNKFTTLDKDFNKDTKFQNVKEIISNFFKSHLL